MQIGIPAALKRGIWTKSILYEPYTKYVAEAAA